jgi:hypothetical protein
MTKWNRSNSRGEKPPRMKKSREETNGDSKKRKKTYE